MNIITKLFSSLKHIYKNLQIARFSELAAEKIDQIYRQDAPTALAKAKQKIEGRFIYVFLFTPLVLIDLVTSLALSVLYFTGALIFFDSRKEHYLEYSKEYSTLFTKNLIALIAWPIGLLSVRLVSFLFIPEARRSEVVTSGSKLYNGELVLEETPTSIEQLQDIIQRANENNVPIMTAGARYSQGEQFIPIQNEKNNHKNVVLLNLKNFNQISINSEQKTATVGAGAKWVDLQFEANKLGLAVQVMQASNVFSIGGSISTNVHGWNHRAGTLNNTIKSLTLITPQGTKLKLDESSLEFPAVMGGFGLLGAIVEAEIKLTDNEKLMEITTPIALKEYVEYFNNKVQVNSAIRMHYYRLPIDPTEWFNKEGFAINYEKIKNTTNKVVTPNFHAEPPSGALLDRILFNVARRSLLARKIYLRQEFNTLVSSQSLKTTNEVMQPPINAMFNSSVSEGEWLQEYFIVNENLMSFLEDFKQLLVKNNVTLLNASIRFVKKDTLSILTYAPEDRYAIVICWNQSLQTHEIRKTKKWIRESYDLVQKYNSSYYLPYQAFASNAQFNSAYPNYENFLAIKDQLDPNGIFNSGFYQRYLKVKSLNKNYLKLIMDDEILKDKFSLFLKNILQRVDSEKFYRLLSDILQYCDLHEEIYQELQDRLPEIMPSMLGSLVRILNSLASIKKDLAIQAKLSLGEADLKLIDGLVEIGYPGRFIRGFKSNFKVTGTITAVYENQSLSDYLQSGFPIPYDKFVQLDYNNPDLSSINSNSADLMTCYVGLHHFPNDQLDQFLNSVSRILRENGYFILVDHDVDDAIDKDAITMAHAAHSVFNVVTGVNLKDEENEVRNFEKLDYWKECLLKHNLNMQEDGPPMIREGDPTRNRMVRFCNQKYNRNNFFPTIIPTNDSLARNDNSNGISKANAV